MSPVEFVARLNSEFENITESQQLLRDYFATDGNRFTGSQFEKYCDSSRPNEITEKDLMAVKTLSVDIPVRPALWILDGDGARQISALLSQVKTTTEIWETEGETALAEGGPLWELWDLLSNAYWPQQKVANGLASTMISKLIATKRPRLSPILDSVITKTVFPGVSRYWDSFRMALSDPDLRERLLHITDVPEIPENVSLLRRIDVVLWSRNKSNE